MNDPLDHMWQCLKADSNELAVNPQLEKRLMNEMNRSRSPRPAWKKLAIAAGLLLGCLVLSGGIAMAAGYNPFKTFFVTFDGNNVVVTDETGQQVSGELVNYEVKEANGQKEVTVQIHGGQQGKTMKLQTVPPPKN